MIKKINKKIAYFENREPWIFFDTIIFGTAIGFVLAYAKDHDLQMLGVVVVSVLLRLVINIFSFNSSELSFSQINFSGKLILITAAFCTIFGFFFIQEFNLLKLFFGVLLAVLVGGSLALITIVFRALRYPVSYFNRLAFYASGVLFDPSKLHEPFLSLANMNPFYWIYFVVMN